MPLGFKFLSSVYCCLFVVHNFAICYSDVCENYSGEKEKNSNYREQI
jgi:hypothetical protein